MRSLSAKAIAAMPRSREAHEQRYPSGVIFRHTSHLSQSHVAHSHVAHSHVAHSQLAALPFGRHLPPQAVKCAIVEIHSH
jgi:hypothetical protein